MKTKLVLTLAALGLALPGIANAQTTRADLRHDRHAVHHEHREMVRAANHGHWKQARNEHRDLAHARHELRHDRRDFRRTH